MRFNAVSGFLVIFVCLFVSATACSGKEAYDWAMFGGRMSPEEKVSLEEQVAMNPADVESRTKLLGYYFVKGRKDADAKSAKQGHVLWLIENAPESEVLGLPYAELHKRLEPEGYDGAKKAWLKIIQKSPDNLAVLKNASGFFFLQDRKLTEELLLAGQKLDAKDRQWPASLGQLYSLELISLPEGPVRKATAAKAFRQFELAYDLSKAIEKDSLLSYMGKTALVAGLNDDAKKLAVKVLDDDSTEGNRGDRVHHGNLILGRIALVDGNVAEAKSRLLLAGKTGGSPQLKSFGPNMLLAKELLERGEKAVVLEYLGLCKKFWTSPNQELEQWTNDVRSNRIPKFGTRFE